MLDFPASPMMLLYNLYSLCNEIFIRGPLSSYLTSFSYNADMHICLQVHLLQIVELTGSPYFICHVLCIHFIVVPFLGGKSVWMSFSFFSGSKPYIMALFTYFWLLLPAIVYLCHKSKTCLLQASVNPKRIIPYGSNYWLMHH